MYWISAWILSSWRRPLYTIHTEVSFNMGQKQSTSIPEATAGMNNIQYEKQQQQQTKNNNKIVIDKKIADMVESNNQPGDDDAANHNYGQPLRPPHYSSPSSQSSTSSMKLNNDKSGRASKLLTDCRAEQRASLACIEENYHNKNEACASHFENYKRCRKEEHERKLEANAKASAW